MKLPLPLEAYQLAERYQLGTPVKMVVRSNGFLFISTGVVFMLLLFLVGILVFLSYVGYTLTFEYHWFAWIFVSVFVAMGVNILFTLRLLRDIVSDFLLHARGYFCKEGFVYLQEKKTLALRWEQIEHVSRYKGAFAILLKDGNEVMLNAKLGIDWKKYIDRRIHTYNKRKQQV